MAGAAADDAEDPAEVFLARGYNLFTAPISDGQFSRIHRATRRRVTDAGAEFDEDVVIKEYLGEDSTAFSTDLEMTAAVQSHPNVVALCCSFDGVPRAMVMEWYSGGDLYDLVTGTSQAFQADLEASVAQVTRDLLSALQHVHTLQIVHRDVKPENVVAHADGRYVLIDFGIAAYTADRANMMRKCCTIGFAAPEVLMGVPYNTPVDIFSLGCVLYFCFCHRHPFCTEGNDMNSICAKTVECRVRFGAQFDAMNRDCISFIAALLNQRPVKRPSARKASRHRWLTQERVTAAAAATLVASAAAEELGQEPGQSSSSAAPAQQDVAEIRGEDVPPQAVTEPLEVEPLPLPDPAPAPEAEPEPAQAPVLVPVAPLTLMPDTTWSRSPQRLQRLRCLTATASTAASAATATFVKRAAAPAVGTGSASSAPELNARKYLLMDAIGAGAVSVSDDAIASASSAMFPTAAALAANAAMRQEQELGGGNAEAKAQEVATLDGDEVDYKVDKPPAEENVSTAAPSLARRWSIPGYFAQAVPYAESRSGTLYRAFEEEPTGDETAGIEGLIVKVFDKHPELYAVELKITKAVQAHPNIVSLASYYDGAASLLTMPFLAGGDLFHRVVDGGTMAEAEAGRVMQNLLSALVYIHRRGIVHRNVKPEKITCHQDRYMLRDFCQAAYLSDAEGMRQRRGTPGYVAPEVLLHLTYGTPADVFGAGAVLYFCLCRRHPFCTDSMDANSVCAQTTKCKISYGVEFQGVSNACTEAIGAMMNRCPSRRPTAKKAMRLRWLRFMEGAEATTGSQATEVALDNPQAPQEHFEPQLQQEIQPQQSQQPPLPRTRACATTTRLEKGLTTAVFEFLFPFF
eukprot:TRINITY_DN13036_c0_g1_i1.p1 TRINITY_DN13036_c0_g1~~TRINITY_DN13036_c0_g1_i1.p1  ORF type:complete len:884 (+),score=182.90 TRINITY_DN13036_c0_g1_i1:80-2653(+)